MIPNDPIADLSGIRRWRERGLHHWRTRLAYCQRQQAEARTPRAIETAVREREIAEAAVAELSRGGAGS